MICKCMYQYVITFTSVLVYFCVIFSDISEEDKSDTMLPAVEVKEAKWGKEAGDVWAAP